MQSRWEVGPAKLAREEVGQWVKEDFRTCSDLACSVGAVGGRDVGQLFTAVIAARAAISAVAAGQEIRRAIVASGAVAPTGITWLCDFWWAGG